MAHKIMTPDQEGFFERPSEAIARDLPGHALKSKAGQGTIIETEGFSGLPRKGMIQDYGRHAREPGDICVTNFRGFPQLNVVGTDTSTKRQQQLTWMKVVEIVGNGEIANNRLVRDIMEAEGAEGKPLDYAIDVLDGKNLQDKKSPLRVAANDETFFAGRKAIFVAHDEEAASNSVGKGMLSFYDVNTTVDQLKSILEERAGKLGLTLKTLLTPDNFAKAVLKDPVLGRIIAQYENKMKK